MINIFIYAYICFVYFITVLIQVLSKTVKACNHKCVNKLVKNKPENTKQINKIAKKVEYICQKAWSSFPKEVNKVVKRREKINSAEI